MSEKKRKIKYDKRWISAQDVMFVSLGSLLSGDNLK